MEQSCSLKTRLENLKNELNQSAKSDSNSEIQTPIQVLFYLYENAAYSDVYINHMEGFRLLIEWLRPVEVPCNNSIEKIPRLHGSYEINEIAAILDLHPSIVYREYSKWILTFDSSNCHTVVD